MGYDYSASLYPYIHDSQNTNCSSNIQCYYETAVDKLEDRVIEAIAECVGKNMCDKFLDVVWLHNPVRREPDQNITLHWCRNTNNNSDLKLVQQTVWKCFIWKLLPKFSPKALTSSPLVHTDGQMTTSDGTEGQKIVLSSHWQNSHKFSPARKIFLAPA